MKKTVSIIGAGVAGLASACRLQRAGYQVTLYEQEALPGGKMHKIQQDGYQFDLGPTIVMMLKLYREVFEVCGVNPNDYIPMQRLDPMYSKFFEDERDEHYEISSDPGAGVPIALLSTRTVTEELLHDDKRILFHTR